MQLQSIILIVGLTHLSSAVQLGQPSFPISNPSCPAFPVPAATSKNCGSFTYRWCDSPTASCPVCNKQAGGGTPLAFTGYPDPPKDYVVDVESYAFYHVMNLEYLVEFSKNPMPFQEAVDMPFCGPPQNNNVTLATRGLFGKGGGTLGQIASGIKHLGGEIQKGLAPIAAPLFKPAPKRRKFLPRPACIPKTILVPIHFTVFTTNFTTSQIVTPDVLERQVNETNTAFKPLGISFFISSLSYHVGREWEKFTHNKNGGPPDYFAYAERIKAENRYGGNDEVNIWVVEKIDEMDCQTSVATSGYCTLARNLNQKSHSVDGCAITIDSLPDIAWRGGNKGDGTTLTHELGHWFDLPHIFPDNKGKGCEGESDDISDTFQFPNNPNMFDAKQPRCCLKVSGKKKTWSLCQDDRLIDVTNFMSYSSNAGTFIEGTDPGSMPWTTEQRAHMFATYFTLRRTPPAGGITCNDYPVFFDEAGHAARSFSFDKRGLFSLPALQGKNLLKAGDRLLDDLKKLCSKAPDDNVVHGIDVISGEVIPCDENGESCKTPSVGLSCPDGSSPPCSLEQACVGGGKPPCQTQICPDNTAPPCTGVGGVVDPGGQTSCPGGGNTDTTCPDGSKPICGKTGDGDGKNTDGKNKDGDGKNTDGKNKDGDGKNTDGKNKDGDGKNTDGKNKDGDGKNKDGDGKEKDGSGKNNDPSSNSGTCVAGCNIHSNACDKTTAPTCIFPDPRVSNPRAACACRPGFKATNVKDTDTTKQWRLAIPGQEHRVWVAEGVSCDTLCGVSTGFDSCREVAELPLRCASL